MLSQFFVYPGVIRKREVGPLGPHVSGFVQAQKAQGYTRSVVRAHARAVARLSKWLRRRKLDAHDLASALISTDPPLLVRTDPGRQLGSWS